MKTINGDRAKWIAERLRFKMAPNTHAALIKFAGDGTLVENMASNYHSEVDHLLSHQEWFRQCDVDDLKLLKKYLTKYAPVNIRDRDPENIKHLEYNNQRYQGEKIRVQITWSELIITDSMGEVNSISLDDARALARAILNF
jgi:hypothetical protein